MVHNTDMRSEDYENLRTVPRPSHSDYTGGLRYRGFNDIRGGGHFSGRLTAPLVFAGALWQRLPEKTAQCRNRIPYPSRRRCRATGPSILVNLSRDLLLRLREETLPLIDHEAEDKIKETWSRPEKTWIPWGVIECAVLGAAAGLGKPHISDAESRISSMLYSVPA